MKNVFEGDDNSIFLSQSLEGVDDEKRDEIFRIAREYQGLCFYKGKFIYWADSIDGVYLNDLDLVCGRILDNFDYMLGLIKMGGEEVLKMISPFQSSFMGKEGSVIEYLRNTFRDDEILNNILLEMSREDGVFKDLDTQQKRLLCTYPDGVLIKDKGSTIEMISFDKVKEILDSYKNEKDASFEDYIFNLYSKNRYTEKN